MRPVSGPYMRTSLVSIMIKYSVSVCKSVFIFLIAVVSLTACAPEPVVMPASFEVISLKVVPAEVLEGQAVTITASIINSGGMPGNFDEPLLVGGTEISSKVITLQPGTMKTLTYVVTKNKSGTYPVSLHNTKSQFRVKAIVPKEMELKYDNDKSRTALWAGYNGGFLTDFTPADLPFTISKISICGGIYGMGWEGKTFDIYILDSDMKSTVFNQTYAIARFPVKGAFPYQSPSWTDFEIPGITVNGKFYIYLYTSTGEHKGIHVGVDDTVFNEHSQLAQGKPPYIGILAPGNLYRPTIWYADTTKVNWMIRVAGTALVAED
jgi:hypothetical protein